jgi:hypothetical protein
VSTYRSTKRASRAESGLVCGVPPRLFVVARWRSFFRVDDDPNPDDQPLGELERDDAPRP